MTINELQVNVDNWINKYGVRYFNVLTNNILLMEEVGELSRLIARTYGEQSFKERIEQKERKKKIADELADIIFVVICLANQQGIDLTDAIHKNFLKKSSRDINRHYGNSKLQK